LLSSQDLFNKFSTKAAELQSKTIDLGSDNVLVPATEFVAPRVTRDFASPAHTPDDYPTEDIKEKYQDRKGSSIISYCFSNVLLLE